MNKSLLIISIILMSLVSGCSRHSSFLVSKYGHPNPTPEEFIVCHGYGCNDRTGMRLGSADWANIRNIFSKPAESAHEERKQIAQAVALFEQQIGPVLGIDKDLPESPMMIFYNTTQTDCIDETINTTTLLRMLKQANLLRWHDVGRPARRGYLVDGRWPHNTAVIVDKQTKEELTVDSWFRANGQEPIIIPVELWRSGWSLRKQQG